MQHYFLLFYILVFFKGNLVLPAPVTKRPAPEPSECASSSKRIVTEDVSSGANADGIDSSDRSNTPCYFSQKEISNEETVERDTAYDYTTTKCSGKTYK